MLNNQAKYKYETQYRGPCWITWCFTNGTVNLQYGTTIIRYNIHHIKLYKSDTSVEDISSKNISDDVNTWLPAISYFVILNIGNKV